MFRVFESVADTVKKGQLSFTSTLPRGLNGDMATTAITINTVRSIQKMNAGLKAMPDVAVPAFSL